MHPRAKSRAVLKGLKGGIGAGDETRTRDINLGKVALYQLSYTRARGWLFSLRITYRQLKVCTKKGRPVPDALCGMNVPIEISDDRIRGGLRHRNDGHHDLPRRHHHGNLSVGHRNHPHLLGGPHVDELH